MLCPSQHEFDLCNVFLKRDYRVKRINFEFFNFGDDNGKYIKLAILNLILHNRRRIRHDLPRTSLIHE